MHNPRKQNLLFFLLSMACSGFELSNPHQKLSNCALISFRQYFFVFFLVRLKIHIVWCHLKMKSNDIRNTKMKYAPNVTTTAWNQTNCSHIHTESCSVPYIGKIIKSICKYVILFCLKYIQGQANRFASQFYGRHKWNGVLIATSSTLIWPLYRTHIKWTEKRKKNQIGNNISGTVFVDGCCNVEYVRMHWV